MVRKIVLCVGLLVGIGLGASAPSATPSPSEKELQAPLALGDEKPTRNASSPSSEPSVFRALGSMVLVIGLAGGGLWAFRKWGASKLPGSGGSRLKVEETLALGERRFVSILKADEEHFLIATSPQGVTLLARMDSLEAPPPESFGAALEQQHVDLNHPVPVKEMEAMLQGNRR